MSLFFWFFSLLHPFAARAPSVPLRSSFIVFFQGEEGTLQMNHQAKGSLKTVSAHRVSGAVTLFLLRYLFSYAETEEYRMKFLARLLLIVVLVASLVAFSR